MFYYYTCGTNKTYNTKTACTSHSTLLYKLDTNAHTRKRVRSFFFFLSGSRTITYTTYLAQLGGQHGAQRAAAARVRVATLHVNVPRCLAVEALVRRIAPPQALDQHGGGRNLPIEVLLALLLLHFERKTRTENALCVCVCE